MYWSRIKKGDFTEAEDVATALSDYTRDVMAALKNNSFDKDVIELFESLALFEKPSYVTKGVFQLEETVFLKYREVLLPLLCSRQFVFLIYGSTRTIIVQRKAEPGMLKYIAMTEYISRYNPNEAKAVQGYLLALKACLDKNREEALSILRNTDIESDVPAQWKREASNIKCYAEGKSSTFRADSTIVDSSLENERVDIKLGFIEKLQTAHNIERRRLDAENAATLYERYLEQSTDFQERVKACLNLILNYPKLSKEQSRALQLPTKYSLMLSLGLSVIEEGYFFNTTDRLVILFELYSGRKMFRDNTDGKKRLNDLLGQSLKTNISLELWVKYCPIIKEFLEENHMIMDFAILQERILERCAILLDENTSQEKRYAGLKYLLTKSEGLESLYSRNVFDAIRRVCRRIEDSPRLSITIVNDNQQMTDGFVYFMIQNIGKCTVTLSDDYIVLFKQEGHPERIIEIDSIKDLQSGFITGGKAKPVISGLEDTVSVNLAVLKRTNTEKTEVLCDSNAKLIIGDVAEPLQISRRNRYKVGTDSAVTDSDMLFGRTEIQNTLKDMIPAGVTVLYGPSRIGKTSIMNWIRNTYAVDQGNVMSIIFGGEGGLGKESDYKENFVNSSESHLVPYEDDAKMAEYLLVSTIIQSMTAMKRRLKMPSMKKVSSDVLAKIVEILQDGKMSIADRYYYVNELLKEEDLQLWLLLDEFQQVVELWKPKASCEFVEVCKMLLYDGENSNIKLILSGSDDLLRHMVLEDESVWRITFPEYARVSVEPLKKDAFCDMIIKDKKLLGTNVSYSSSALDALFSYTGGVALYGKEIGNVILDAMEREPSNYQGRNTVYASDVAEATQRLLNRQASELDTKAKEGIREIYDAVTKNLKYDTDMQYLWYIAKWLKANPNYDSFSETIFTNNSELRDEKELHDSLEIAVARGILDCRESGIDGVNNYVFRTIFYYFAFLGSSKNNLDERKIFVQEGIEETMEWEESVKDILLSQDHVSVGNMIDIIDALDDSNIKEGIGRHYGDGKTIHTEKYVEQHADKITEIEKQNNYVVNVQNITNTLNGIITASDPVMLRQRIQELPRLADYLPALANDTKNGDSALSEDMISRAMDNYVADLEESLEAVDKQTPHFSKTNADVMPELTMINSSHYEEAPVQETYATILRVSDEKYAEFMEHYKLPVFFLRSLKFAYQLDELFMRGAVGDEMDKIDFSPVTIMYCKLVESLLKEYHISIYADSFKGIDTDMRKPENKDEKYKWEDIVDLPVTQQQRLTIGSFVFPLYPKGAINKLVIATDKDAEEWIEHKKMVMAVKDIRNPSAHGNKDHRISLEQKEKITDMLFSNHGFMRLIELALG